MKTYLSQTPRTLSLALCAAALFVAGCSTQKADDRPPEEIVKERAAQRWDAMLVPDLDQAYTYLAPSVRTVMSSDGFKRRFNIANPKEAPWKKYEVRSVTCEEPEVCTAKVFIEAQVNIPKFRGMSTSALTEERWVLQDGQWWLYMR